ncbi:MAG: hypothetical protein K5899_10865 [Bacteroidaceae bacterium]|nr:hypothetical protein [Bacteroidaceae bacterium]
MTLYGTGQICRRCLCPLHDDHHPSLHLNAPRNIFKCFSCGKGGDVISLTCFFNPRREKSNRNRFTVYRLG